jgi:uncharacterized membrane protein YfcA
VTDNLWLFFGMTAVVAFSIGVAKGGLGGTLAALATPMMALVMPADKVIGLILPILMFADIFAVALHWRGWNTKLVLLLLPGAVLGVTIGTLFITNVPTETLRTTLGIIILIFAVYRILESRILKSLNYQPRNWHGLIAGMITGFSSSLAHTGGPLASIYLLLQNISPTVFVGTSVAFFFILNWIKFPYYIYADLFDLGLLKQIAWLLPLVPLGVWTGKWAVTRVEKSTFDRIIVYLLIVSALLLIFT